MRVIALLLIANLNSVSFGGMSPIATFKCKVGSFDPKIVSLNCDPQNKEYLKTPASWISKDADLHEGKYVRLDLTRDQIKTWGDYNKGTEK